MQFVLPIIAIIILGVAEISMNNTTPPTPPSPTPHIKKPNTSEENILPTNKITQKENQSAKVIPTETIQKPSENLLNQKDYLYPHAIITSSSENEIFLESNHSPQEITDWYKTYIQENNMNTTSFVTTNSNNNILNKLAGSGNGKSISVEIQKNENENKVHIKILRSN